jgi:MoaA/NifB/PqqE/SkfB family radical SAM enzyme
MVPVIMTIEHTINDLKKQYNVLAVIDLDQWHSMSFTDAQAWLEQQCNQLKQAVYQHNDRIIFVQKQGDVYVKKQRLGQIVRNLQIVLGEIDISNWFVILISANPEVCTELESAKQLLPTCDNTITGIYVAEDPWQPKIIDKHPSNINEMYKYGSVNPLKISLAELSDKEQHLLSESKVFCIYPWIHLNSNPDGKAMPCCMTDHKEYIGDCHKNTLEEIWNNDRMKQIRVNMLNETPVTGCSRCYEQEQAGFFSGRQSANKHHGHHIDRVLETKSDGQLDRFEMIYWDIRFSNLCNLKCRSCGHIYSSQWYQDQAKLAGPKWTNANQVLNYAGRTVTDMWEQLLPHIDHVEQIYFAGGEPLLMEEHYLILEELERRERFDVRLIYNTNFTHVKLKDRWVFDYWRKFDSVSVGASLDASGARGEYIRKGTNWDTVERNREQMLTECPGVDFYVSSTLSILNALHLPDFHKEWVEKGFIKPQDFNVNILLDPEFYRIDIATEQYKELIREKYQQHIHWLSSQDKLGRASQGYTAAISLLSTNNNTYLLDKFWSKTAELDAIRNENLLDVIPELSALK